MSILQERMAQPRHEGALEDATHVGAIGNPACGDVLTLYLRLEGDRIEAAGFESVGSTFQLATADVLCDCITGQKVEEAKARGPECVLKRLPDLPEHHQYLARLAIDALTRALSGDAASAPQADTEALSQEEACAWLKNRLQRGGKLRTQQLHAVAESEGLQLPGSALRCLSELRRRGEIEGEMDVREKAWKWWIVA